MDTQKPHKPTSMTPPDPNSRSNDLIVQLFQLNNSHNTKMSPANQSKMALLKKFE